MNMSTKSKYRQTPPRDLTPDELKVRAEENFKRREQQKIDAPLAMREYREAEEAARGRMEKQRAARLARKPIATQD